METVTKVIGNSGRKLCKEERRVITKAVNRFFERYTERDPFMCRLLGLDAALHSLKWYDMHKAYEPREVFEVMYARFGDELFSQYTHSFTRIHSPTPEELNSPTLEGLSPAAHYFTKSAALWEYGMEKFGLKGMATDQYSNTGLIMAIKHREIAGAISMIQTSSNLQERLALVGHKNRHGETALKIATTAALAEKEEDYQKLIKLLQIYSHIIEKP